MTLKETMVEDLPTFFNPEEFATPAVYDGGIELEVLFDLESDDNAESLIPVIRCAVDALPVLERGKFFEIEGRRYGVVNWYEDADAYTIVCNEER
jgi:hypothetical protein